jgi:hypothetical protein
MSTDMFNANTNQECETVICVSVHGATSVSALSNYADGLVWGAAVSNEHAMPRKEKFPFLYYTTTPVSPLEGLLASKSNQVAD